MKKWSSKLIIGLVLLFLYLPIIVLIVFSFNDTKLNIADVVKIADYTIDNSIQIWK